MGHTNTGGRISEAVIQRQICDYLQSYGFFFWRSNNVPVMGRALPKYTPRGLPDIMVIVNGLFVAFEVKRPTVDGMREKNGRTLREGKLSPEQADFGIRLEGNGGRYYCVRSADEARAALEEVFTHLKKSRGD